jgi:hypothetical protein
MLFRTLPKLFDSAETTASEHHEDIIGNLGAWFPHIGVRLSESSKVVLI